MNSGWSPPHSTTLLLAARQVQKLAICCASVFFESGDALFGYRELNKTVYFLVNGWVTMSLDGPFLVEINAVAVNVLAVNNVS